MMQLVFTPKWFFGKDIVIDIISILVLLLISTFTFRYYKINKNKNYLLLSTSFGLISMSFIFKIMTNFTIYYPIWVTKKLGFFSYTYQAIHANDLLFSIGYLIYRILTLIGLYYLFTIYKKQSSSSSFLIFYLLVVSTYFTLNAYYIFHITSFVMLLIICLELLKQYRKNPKLKLLMYSFATIAISQTFFVYVKFYSVLYVIAEFTQLIGYILLLSTFIKVLYRGKKKK